MLTTEVTPHAFIPTLYKKDALAMHPTVNVPHKRAVTGTAECDQHLPFSGGLMGPNASCTAL